jgi:hypothetical protein
VAATSTPTSKSGNICLAKDQNGEPKFFGSYVLDRHGSKWTRVSEMRLASLPITRALVKCAAVLAFCVIVGCHQSATSADPCAPPPPWNPAGAKPGQPDQEFATCLRDQAYETRNLAIPINSVAQGIIAQCQIRVDRFEGRMADENAAAERDADRPATAAVIESRRCIGQ